MSGMKDIHGLYKAMLESYGPGGWWPLSKGRLQTKHHSNPPKNKKDRQDYLSDSCKSRH